MKDLININRLNRFGQNIWSRIKDVFMTKEDAINGVLVGQEWTLLESVVGNSPIILPSTDSFTELYIEMYSSNGTITHNINIRLDSILFESSNNEYREILLDSVYDAQTYVKYDFVTNSIIPIMYEGNEITDSLNITTRVYTKTNNIEVGNIEAEKIVYDNSVSELSTNNVQGAIDEVVRTLGYTVTSKNLLPNITKSVAKLGLTFTYNSDGTVTVNGTATEDCWYDLCHRIISPITLKKNSYVLSGCANGGSDSGYYMAVCKTVNGSGEEIAKDYGNGVSFTLNEDTNVGAFIYIKEGTTVNNLTFYPMIRYASIEDSTFESYVEDLNTKLKHYDYLDIRDKITLLDNIQSITHACVKNGNVYIAGFINGGTPAGSANKLFKIADEFKPKYLIIGNYALWGSGSDNGKVASVTMTTEGIGYTWLLNASTGHIGFSFTYPLI